MRLGINIPYHYPDGRAYTLAEAQARACAVEEAGFDSIWIGDTIGRGRTMQHDPLMYILAAASGTQAIELGISIIQVPLRNPVELAQRLLTLHVLSGGRFRAGVGAGSTQADFDACGVDFTQRFHLLAERLPVIRALCRGEKVGNAQLNPPSNALGGPPIFVGSWASGLWVKRAARKYDGWLASGRTGNESKTLSEGLARYREAGGKRALIATVGIDLSSTNTTIAANEPFNLRCPPDLARERLQELAELGFDDVMFLKQDQTLDDLPAIRALI